MYNILIGRSYNNGFAFELLSRGMMISVHCPAIIRTANIRSRILIIFQMIRDNKGVNTMRFLQRNA